MRCCSICFFLCISLFVQGKAQANEFAWLLGSWKLQTKNNFEVWKLAADGQSLEGKSFKISEQDTLVLEEIRILSKEGSFYYVPDVAGEQGPVYFKISSYNKEGFEAENPDHDFPKIIRYKLSREKGRTFLRATIEGNGKSIPFLFEKTE